VQRTTQSQRQPAARQERLRVQHVVGVDTSENVQAFVEHAPRGVLEEPPQGWLAPSAKGFVLSGPAASRMAGAQCDARSFLTAWPSSVTKRTGASSDLWVRGRRGIFRSQDQWLAGQAQVEGVRPHGICHTAISSALKEAGKKGTPIEEVLAYSAHSRQGRSLLLRYRDNLGDKQAK
jgi:hypothetical protein